MISPATQEADTIPAISYDSVKKSIKEERLKYSAAYFRADEMQRKQIRQDMTDFWDSVIGISLYNHWSGTAWDFNGTTSSPKEGAVACGYFVTVIL